MLMIRLQRVGRKNIPMFRVVLTDSKNSTKSGKYLEVLGSFDMVKKKKTVDAERVKYWISKGAQVTDTLHNYFISEKIIAGKKVNALPRHRPIKKEEAKKEEKGSPAPAPESSAAAVPESPSVPTAPEPAAVAA